MEEKRARGFDVREEGNVTMTVKIIKPIFIALTCVDLHDIGRFIDII